MKFYNVKGKEEERGTDSDSYYAPGVRATSLSNPATWWSRCCLPHFADEEKDSKVKQYSDKAEKKTWGHLVNLDEL